MTILLLIQKVRLNAKFQFLNKYVYTWKKTKWKKSFKCKTKSVGNTRLLAHAKMLLVLMNFFLWRVDYTWRKTFWLSKCDFCRLFHTERSWHAFSAVIVVCGRHDCCRGPIVLAIACSRSVTQCKSISFTSFEMQCFSFRLNKGFRLFNFLLSASWIRTIISDFLLVRDCDGSYDVLSRDNYRLPRFCVSHYQV